MINKLNQGIMLDSLSTVKGLICMGTNDKIIKILWSIAFPGFGQILNGHLTKGILFVTLEILINTKSGLNQAIISSFKEILK